MPQRRIGVILSYVNIFVKNFVFFLYMPFLLEHLGQAEYGLYQMTNSVVQNLTLLSMGFSSAYVRFYMVSKVKNDQEEIKRLNGLYLILFAIFSVIALILGMVMANNTEVLFSKSLSPQELMITKNLMVVLVINISLAFISSVFDSFIIANEKFRFQQNRQLLQTVLSPLLTIPLILIGYRSFSIVIVQTGVTLFFLILNIKYSCGDLKMRFTFKNLPFKLFREISAFSFFIFLNQIVDIVNNNFPSFIVGVYLGAKDVAVYSIAAQLKNIFYLISTSLSSVFTPIINELSNNETDNFELVKLMTKIGRIQLLLLTFVLGGFIIVGDFFIEKWAGTENAFAYNLLIIMVFPVIVPLSQNIGIEIQRAKNKHIFRSVVYTLLAVLNIIITTISIHFWGLIGSTFGFVFSIVVGNGIIMNIYYHKNMKLNMIYFWKNIINIGIPFFSGMFLSLFLKKLIHLNSWRNFLVLGLTYCVTYFIVYLTFAINNYEKNLMRGILKKSSLL